MFWRAVGVRYCLGMRIVNVEFACSRVKWGRTFGVVSVLWVESIVVEGAEGIRGTGA